MANSLHVVWTQFGVRLFFELRMVILVASRCSRCWSVEVVLQGAPCSQVGDWLTHSIHLFRPVCMSCQRCLVFLALVSEVAGTRFESVLLYWIMVLGVTLMHWITRWSIRLLVQCSLCTG